MFPPAEMGGEHHGIDALGEALLQHCDGFINIVGAIVNIRQYVRVKINHG